MEALARVRRYYRGAYRNDEQLIAWAVGRLADWLQWRRQVEEWRHDNVPVEVTGATLRIPLIQPFPTFPKRLNDDEAPESHD